MNGMKRIVGRGMLAFAAIALAACGDDTTGVEVVFEVIEETTFAPSLGVDLETMERTGTGVYYKDLVVGAGEPAFYGTTPTVTFTGWLTDGSEFDTGTFSFFMGNNQVILGFEDGLLGTREGGTRLMVIPPNRGYGGQDLPGIPAGSVLVFEVTVDAVATN